MKASGKNVDLVESLVSYDLAETEDAANIETNVGETAVKGAPVVAMGSDSKIVEEYIVTNDNDFATNGTTNTVTCDTPVGEAALIVDHQNVNLRDVSIEYENLTRKELQALVSISISLYECDSCCLSCCYLIYIV